MGRATVAAALAVLGLVGAAGAARAGSIPFTQGFETDTSSWSFATDASGTATINRVASGGGVLGLTAKSGGYYAELGNGESGFNQSTPPSPPGTPGLGDAGYSNLGGHVAGAYPGSAFAQSIDMYIDPTWAAASSSRALVIDMTASSQATGLYDYGTENDFNLMSPSGGQMDVTSNAGGTIATLTNAGWYTFRMTFAPGVGAGSDSTTTLEVLDATGNVVGTPTTFTNGSLSSDLGGSGYVWITEWDNGFADNTIGIDNVQAVAVPLPSAAGMGLAATALIAGAGVVRKKLITA